DYFLWFANQTARHNILNGMKPPETGHWLNNPCADDIDFQIEADFIGLLCPGMPNTASELCDKVGHIMNYGDGWYGGVYVAAMYALAFIYDDVLTVVQEALKTIPANSKFALCINDVIRGYKENPDNWKSTWFKIHEKWSEDMGSPRGVFDSFNIDAKINAAWVVIGLLYGKCDFSRTYQISTRCGDDADCNPATAGGILATIKGYGQIPDFWKQGLADVEDIDFKYTTMSLNDAYTLSFKHALEVIRRNGGKVDEDAVTIQVQQPETVPLEIAFEHHYPIEKRKLNENLKDEKTIQFNGIGFAINGEAIKKSTEEYTFQVEMYIDDELIETISLPTPFKQRRFTPFWRYQLPEGDHEVKLRLLNPTDTARMHLSDMVVYGKTPYKAAY
ncbi:ADP-ribosylglycohydrolase family protein, partial [candidate division KSB1 bacterium]|nr:ADP-ribosylglycohydrolase family protein [candidate division KSB1 bacterium]